MTDGNGRGHKPKAGIRRNTIGRLFSRTKRDSIAPRAPTLHPESELATFIRQDPATWARALEAAKQGPRVLIPTAIGGHPSTTTFEALIAVALTLRGANVEFLLCDKKLPACLMCNHSGFHDTAEFALSGPGRICNWCYPAGRAMYEPLGLPIRTLGEYLTETDRAQACKLAAQVPLDKVPTCCFEGLQLGQHAFAGAVRFFVRGDLAEEPLAEPVLRRYLEAAWLSAFSLRALLVESPYQIAFFHHGIYVPQGIFGEVFRQSDVRVVNWTPAYRKHCFVFSHHRSPHFTLLDEPTKLWEELELTAEMENQLMSYLGSRWQGTNDWSGISPYQPNSSHETVPEIEIDFSKPTIGLLTNVLWDAQLFYEGNAFATMRDWVFETIAYFARRPDLQLLIRVHPAELRGTLVSRQPIISEIKRRFPQLPGNIFIIPPESNQDTYRAMIHCDSVIIFGTKTGMELATLGIPIIVAGEAWVRDKGITLDAHSRAEYLQLLDRLPLREKLDPATIIRARKYAYHFFFRRMIPINFVDQEPTGWKPYRFALDRLNDLQSGRDPGLDLVCAGILNGTEFVYPSESFATASTPKGMQLPPIYNNKVGKIL